MIRSNKPIIIGSATITLNKNVHDNRPLILNVAAGTAVTLPAATGSGVKFKFIVGTASNANTISAAPTTDSFVGGIFINDTGDTSAATADFYPTVAGGSNSNKISPVTTGGGGAVGDVIEITDMASGSWAVTGVFQLALDPATPFSHV